MSIELHQLNHFQQTITQKITCLNLILIFPFYNNFMTCKYLLILAFLAIMSSCRKFQTVVKFSQLKEHNGWYFIEKFKFSEGYARFEVEIYVRGKAKSKSNHQVYIQGVPQSKWEEQQEKKCKSPINMPVFMKALRVTGQKVRDVFQFSVNENQTYYFVIKDCLQLFRKDYENEDAVLHIKFHASNNDMELDDAPDQVNSEEESEEVIYEEPVEENEGEAQQTETQQTEEQQTETQQTEAPEQTIQTQQTEEVVEPQAEQQKNIEQL